VHASHRDLVSLGFRRCGGLSGTATTPGTVYAAARSPVLGYFGSDVIRAGCGSRADTSSSPRGLPRYPAAVPGNGLRCIGEIDGREKGMPSVTINVSSDVTPCSLRNTDLSANMRLHRLDGRGGFLRNERSMQLYYNGSKSRTSRFTNFETRLCAHTCSLLFDPVTLES